MHFTQDNHTYPLFIFNISDDDGLEALVPFDFFSVYSLLGGGALVHEASLSTSGSSQCSLEGLRGGASAKGKESKNNKNDINLGGGPPGYPNKIIYPGTGRGLSNPPPKKSLYKTNNPKDPVDMAWSAKACILNVIELFHWISFPIGFYLFWTMFEKSDRLAAAIGGSNPILGVFFLLLSHGKDQHHVVADASIS